MTEQDNKIDSNTKEISDLKAQILAQNIEIEELKQSMKTVQNNVSCVSNYVSSESKSLRRIVEGEQVYARQKNLIFEKVKEDKNIHCMDQITGILRRTLKLSVQPKEAYRRGQHVYGKIRPIVVKFKSFADKVRVLKNLKNLRESDDPEPEVYVNEDLPPAMLDSQRTLAPLMKTAKRHDKSARLNKGRLIFKHETYNKSQAFNLPFLDEVSTRTIHDRIYFQGRYSKFSNFHPSSIKIQGTLFPTVEHYFQHTKAIRHGRREIASLIQMADDPRDAKRFGDQIQPAKEWTDTIQFQVMEEGVKAKFATHPRLRD